MTTGRFTLPSEENFAEETARIGELWGADAIRNADGTHLDEDVLKLGKKVYSAYFPTRGHNAVSYTHLLSNLEINLNNRLFFSLGLAGTFVLKLRSFNGCLLYTSRCV